MSRLQYNQYTNQGSSKEMLTYLAEIRYAFPWMNLYVVSPLNGGYNINPTELVSGNCRDRGSIHTSYNVGDIVMVNSDRDNPDSWALTDYIVGVASADSIPDIHTQDIPEDKAQGHPVWYILKQTFDKLKTLFPTKRTDISKTHIEYSDTLPGETHIISTPDVGIDVLKHVIQIRCGHRNMVELDSVLNRIRIVTEKLEYIGPLRNSQDISGKGSLLRYDQEALTPDEGSAYTEDREYALYRHRKMCGDITMGWSESISVPNIDDHSVNDVFRKKIGYDGTLEVTSARGFAFKKSIDVVSVMPITEDHDVLDSTPELDPVGLAVLSESLDDKPDSDKFFDTTINGGLNNDHDRACEFYHSSHNDRAWDTTNNTRSSELSKAVSDTKNRKLHPIGTNQYYDLPDTVELTDPHTGIKYKYYKADSGILYEPDGSLVLYDGYGSEIRMTRGNIIISPAADLIFRPGRDLHAMSGRHTAIVSQKDVTIHSSLSDVYIKAQNTIQTVSGINGEGVTIIENRGAGSNIRSVKNIAVTGRDIFIGNTPDTAPDSLEGYVSGSGTVTIGSGDQVNLLGDTVVAKCNELSVLSNAKSFITVGDDTIAISSETVCINGTARFGYAVGSRVVSIRNTTYSLATANESNVICDVPLYTRNTIESAHIKCNAGEFCILVANNADARTGMCPKTSVSRVSWPDIAITDTLLISTSKQVTAYDVDRNLFVYGNTFQYPSSYDIGLNVEYIIPGMLWQSITTTGMVWEEPSVPGLRDSDSSTMVYPGAEIWGNAYITVPGYDKKHINGGYVING